MAEAEAAERAREILKSQYKAAAFHAAATSLSNLKKTGARTQSQRLGFSMITSQSTSPQSARAALSISVNKGIATAPSQPPAPLYASNGVQADLPYRKYGGRIVTMSAGGHTHVRNL